MKKILFISIIFGLSICFSAMVHALSGDISGVWTAGTTVTIDGDVEIPAGETLVIEPGVQVEFTGRFTFNVLGRLEAVGTVEQLIVFSRAFETEASKWRGLRFDNADDTSVLEYCKIEYVHKDGDYPGVRGGAIWISDCSPSIRYNILTNNYSRNGNYNGTGGGVCLDKNSNSIIEYNTIAFNKADSGGGICIGSDCNAVIRNNRISNNESFYSGGGIYLSAWGHATIYNNMIKDNTVYGWAGGGGITLWNGNCGVDACTHVFNNIIVNNAASTYGGGIYSRYNDSKIYNNTIVNNFAASGGGLHVLNQGNSVPSIFNCIFWGNTASASPQIYLYSDTGSQALITYNNIESGFSGVGNINSDPVFVDALNDNFQLASGSPCIDAGDNESVQLPEKDFYEDNRVGDDPDTIDTGNGQAPIVDIGADEYHENLCPGDLDGDQDVDEDDLIIFARDFGKINCTSGCPADYDADYDVDSLDLSFFSRSYGDCR